MICAAVWTVCVGQSRGGGRGVSKHPPHSRPGQASAAGGARDPWPPLAPLPGPGPVGSPRFPLPLRWAHPRADLPRGRRGNPGRPSQLIWRAREAGPSVGTPGASWSARQVRGACLGVSGPQGREGGAASAVLEGPRRSLGNARGQRQTTMQGVGREREQERLLPPPHPA